MDDFGFIPDNSSTDFGFVPDQVAALATPDASLSTDDYKRRFMTGAEGAFLPSSDSTPQNISPDESFLSSTGRFRDELLGSAIGEMSHPIQDIKEATSSNFVPDKSAGPEWLQRIGKSASAPLGAMSALFSYPSAIAGAATKSLIQQAEEPEERAQMSQSELQKESNVSQAIGSGVTGVAGAVLPLLNPAIHDNIFPPEKPTAEFPQEAPTVEGEYTTISGELPAPDDLGFVPDETPPSAPKSPPIEPAEVSVAEPENAVPEEANAPPKLYIRPAETKDAFNVVDENGDHVQGGFDSRAAAEDYVESANEPVLGSEPEEWNNEIAPYEPPIVHEEPPIQPAQALAAIAPKIISAYHGTEQNFRDFDKSKSQAGDAIYFSTDKEKAKKFSNLGRGNFGRIIKSDLSLQNPLIIKHNEGGLQSHVETAKAKGYDGIIKLDENNNPSSIAVFNVNQIQQKSLVENVENAEQSVILGTEKITDKALAERQMQKPLQTQVAQKPADDGLFDVAGRNQQDLLGFLPEVKNAVASSAITARPSESGNIPERSDVNAPTNQTSNAGNQVRGTPSRTTGLQKQKVKPLSPQELQEYFKPGRLVEGYGGTDKVIAFHPATSNKPWSVDVRYVKPDGAPIPHEDARNHSTLPSTQKVRKVIGDIPTSKLKIQSSVIPPSTIGKPTSLHTFLKNNGGINDEGGNLASMGEQKSLVRKNGLKWDDATELAQQHGYFSERPSITELQDKLFETNAGREHFRDQDIERVVKSQEREIEKQGDDPAYVEHYADRIGLDTAQKPNETTRQFINRLKKAIIEFHKNEEGSVPRQRAGLGNQNKPTEWALKKPIETIEKVTGKLTGNAWQKIGEAYTKIMAPELVSGKALRGDALLAKHKASIAEARNALYKQSGEAERAWDRTSNTEREAFLEAQDTGNYTNNDLNHPAHARYKALTDAAHKAEAKALGRDPAKNYRDNYFPRIWEKPDEVRMYLHSPAMIKKYGPGWFNKAREFDLYREAKQAGFKLASNNPETLLQMRLMAGQDMIGRMNLLRDLESDHLATPARAFSIDKRIASTEADLKNARKRYKEASDKINDPRQKRWDFADPAVNKYMKSLKDRGDKLNKKLTELQQEKTQYKLPESTLAGLKNTGFKIIGPDDKVWHIDHDMIPLWKNVMDSQGLWENKALTGSAYRGWQALRNSWVPIKLGLSLFHPMHVASIHVANGLAEAARNLTQGGKGADSLNSVTSALKMGFGLKGLKGGEAMKAWNKPETQRTAQEQQLVDTMKEGGFVPKMSERDIIHFRRGFENALHGNILQKTVVMPIKGAQGVIRAVSAPIFEHWIPALKTEAYLMRAKNAVARDPTLVNDAGKRGEVFRQIAKDTDRTYGEMNYDTLFWNKAVRDAFNASFLSGGWKLAQLYYARGLTAPFKMAYKYVKTGKLDPKDISHNMMFSYIYGAMALVLGAAFTKMMGGQVQSLKDMTFPQTGEQGKDGKPIRVSLPFFNKEFYSLGKDVNTKGLIGGAAEFAYNQTLFKGIADTLTNQDYVGRQIISDPSDLNQWAHQAWDTVKPITLGSYQQAEARGSKVGKPLSLVGVGLAPAYANETPFEQKILYAYDKQNPPKGDAYTASLKSDYRAASAKNDEIKMNELKKEMLKEGVTGAQVQALNRNYTKPFAEHAWDTLSAIEQRRIYNSAIDEEKDKYRLKPLRTAEQLAAFDFIQFRICLFSLNRSIA